MKRLGEKTKVEHVRFVQMLDELKADGIRQTDFSSVTGISQSYVSNIRSGRYALSLSMAKKIEGAFPKYRAAWLLGLDDRPVSNPVSKVDALKVLDPMVSALSPERSEALLDYVQEFIKFELRKERS